MSENNETALAAAMQAAGIQQPEQCDLTPAQQQAIGSAEEFTVSDRVRMHLSTLHVGVQFTTSDLRATLGMSESEGALISSFLSNHGVKYRGEYIRAIGQQGREHLYELRKVPVPQRMRPNPYGSGEGPRVEYANAKAMAQRMMELAIELENLAPPGLECYSNEQLTAELMRRMK